MTETAAISRNTVQEKGCSSTSCVYYIYLYLYKKLLLPGGVYGIFSAVFKNGKEKFNSTRFAHLNLKGSLPVNYIPH